jgi:hypothetical protein
MSVSSRPGVVDRVAGGCNDRRETGASDAGPLPGPESARRGDLPSPSRRALAVQHPSRAAPVDQQSQQQQQ